MPAKRARKTAHAQTGPILPCPFDRLPDHVLLRIITYAQALSQRDAQELTDQRFARLTTVLTLRPGGDSEYAWAHSLEGDPILSCFQALAVVNRRFYNLAQPLLWKSLQFPTAVPIMVPYYTATLLPKYGKLVRSLTLEVEDDWFDGSTEKEVDRILAPAKQKYSLMRKIKKPAHEDFTCVKRFLDLGHQDNLIWTHSLEAPDRFDTPDPIRRRSAGKIISECVNLRSLTIILPPKCATQAWDVDSEDFSEPEVLPEWFALLKQPKVLFPTTLPSLVHLRLAGARGSALYAAQVKRIIKELPSIQSLELARVARDMGDKMDEKFGASISRLDQLERLSLSSVGCIKPTWNGWFASPKLTRLSILDCSFLSGIRAAWSLNQFPRAAHLNVLELRIRPPQIDFAHGRARRPEEDPEAPGSITTFSLPSLLLLKLWNYDKFDLLPHFKDCRGLRMIQMIYSKKVSSEKWSALTNTIIGKSSSWPKLQTLQVDIPVDETSEVEPNENLQPSETGITSEALLNLNTEKLKTHCLKAGIKFRINKRKFDKNVREEDS